MVLSLSLMMSVSYSKPEIYFISSVDVHSWYSFPSGHSTKAFALFFTLAILTKENGFIGNYACVRYFQKTIDKSKIINQISACYLKIRGTCRTTRRLQQIIPPIIRLYLLIFIDI